MKFFLWTCLFIFIACQKNETIDRYTFFHMAKELDPEIEQVLPKDMASGINCKDYGEGCLGGFTAKVKGLDFIYLEFESEKKALKEAKRINGYYRGNWVFDDVSGEPVLEHFIQRIYQAKNPNK